LAEALVGGITVAEYAARNSLSRNAVRSHLGSLRAKLGVRTQAALVGQLLRALPPLADPAAGGAPRRFGD
jgi:DNA-binding CsgD family transcriptional regulator